MKSFYMKYLASFILILSGLFVNAQVVTTDPEFPSQMLPVTITLNTIGTGLETYTGDIYAHTGVTIEDVGNWQNVIGSWGSNTTQPKLTKIGANLYELEISPSINDFYSVDAGDVVTQMSFVFRSADGTQQTSPDIFVNVYTGGSITFNSPDSLAIYSPGIVNMNAVSILATEMTLYIDETEITTQTGTQLNYDYSVSVPGFHTVRVTALEGTTLLENETRFFVRADNVIEDLPSADLVDGINYIDNQTVTLVLYAPFKEFVFLKGSFDDWDLSLANQMKQTTDGNRYWITLTGLTPGQEYIYQYMVDGELTIADPYADKLSDPWNDSYISNTTYPGLIEYPSGKTGGMASVFQTAQSPYTWVNNDFVRPQNKDLVIYELLIRDFVAAHDYQTLIDTISYLKNLGINAVELMPVSEFEGNSSWGYNPSFYFAPDKYYGTKDKLKEFIDVCHQNDMAVIMDIVLNHSYGLSPLVQLYFNPGTGNPSPENPWYNETSPNTAYSWGYDFNHESPDTKDFVSRVVKYWLDEYRFDGFRFDFTKGFTNTSGDGWAYDASRIEILKDIADTIWTNAPGAYVILEHFAANSEETILANYGMMIWGNVTYSYAQASMGWTDQWDFSWTSYQERGWNNPNLISYMESHDEERMMFRNLDNGNSEGGYDIQNLQTALRRAELAGAFFFTIPGPKMIWQFEELGYDISIDDPCRVCEKPILWNYFSEDNRNKLYRFFKLFIELKKNHEAFSTTDFELNLGSDVKEIFLNGADMDVVIFGNFDVEEHYCIPDLSSSTTWYDYYTQKEYGQSSSFTLDPGEYYILTSVKLALPDVPVFQEIPLAENVTITGDLKVGSVLNASYDFFDKNNDLEGNSIYQWYMAETAIGAGTVPIEGANDTVFTLTAAQSGKYIMFEVTPIAVSNEMSTGLPAKSSYSTMVESLVPGLIAYPSPVLNTLTIALLDTYDYVKISDVQGNIVYEINPDDYPLIDLSFLRPGLYIMKAEKDGVQYAFKIVKL
jgi:1,4-alpha-glucan branching enzyme